MAPQSWAPRIGRDRQPHKAVRATRAVAGAKKKIAVLADGSMRAAAKPMIPMAAAYVAGTNSSLQVRCMFWYSTHTAELGGRRRILGRSSCVRRRRIPQNLGGMSRRSYQKRVMK